jgi:hypothetical protein
MAAKPRLARGAAFSDFSVITLLLELRPPADALEKPVCSSVNKLEVVEAQSARRPTAHQQEVLQGKTLQQERQS